jgi:quercetin dioxygenase-like cupin family protein
MLFLQQIIIRPASTINISAKVKQVGGNKMELIKNINKAEVLSLKDQVAYQEGQVVSKTLSQNDAVSVTLFSFWKGEEISTHESGGDAFVICLDGTGQVTVDGVDYELTSGQAIVMPAGHPHAVFGKENFKMLLTVVFPR